MGIDGYIYMSTYMSMYPDSTVIYQSVPVTTKVVASEYVYSGHPRIARNEKWWSDIILSEFCLTVEGDRHYL